MKSEWRCMRCGKLLGILKGTHLHICFARGHQYIVGVPATTVCRDCRTLNELGVQQEGRGGIAGSEIDVRN